ncbi:MAG: hypothetical protein RQ745_09110, partial [Longimicrobiales bacterium]|nr:hypothetical protein [Longimicrobiales bacterium]
VRDALLGIPSEDWDFATVARPRDVQRVFRRTVPVGIDHGTVGVLDRDGTLHEVTTFRRDVETDGRRAVVSFADRIEDDLARRDFTINAIAWHPLREVLLDPFEGEADLADRRLRTVGRPEERFAEDYLRLLRALRFAGRFDLVIEEATWRALRDGIDGLGGLSAERIREEWVKVMMGEDPSRALALYRESGALARVAPALDDADASAWDEGVAWATALPPDDPTLRTVAVFEAIVPAGIDAEERRARAEGVGGWMQGLRFSNAEIDRAVHLLATEPDPPPLGAPDSDVRRWLAAIGVPRVEDRFRLIEARVSVGLADPDRSAWVARAREVLAAAPPLGVADLAIGGRDLIREGFKPGPRFGEWLDALLEKVLDDPTLNTRDALLNEIDRLRSEEERGAGREVP